MYPMENTLPTSLLVQALINTALALHISAVGPQNQQPRPAAYLFLFKYPSQLLLVYGSSALATDRHTLISQD